MDALPFLPANMICYSYFGILNWLDIDLYVIILFYCFDSRVETILDDLRNASFDADKLCQNFN